MGKWLLCTLKPLGEYFFGGEHIFDMDGVEKSYFITSERMPNQSTLLGVLRFLALSKARLLNNSGNYSNSVSKAQTDLVGKEGFMISGDMKVPKDYGEILSLSPVFLTDSHGHRWIRTPLNHVKTENTFTAFCMARGIRTDINESTLLPINYNAKDGLTDTYTDLDDPGHPVKNCIGKKGLFTFSEHTRISRRNNKEGFFKKACITLDPNYKISFYCEVKSDDALPEKEIVYLGQEKSAFQFCRESVSNMVNPISSLETKIASLSAGNQADVYYAASDLYLPQGISKDSLLFSIVKTKPFRTLTLNLSGGKNYRSSRIRSEEHQLVQAGSVFYIEKDKASALVAD